MRHGAVAGRSVLRHSGFDLRRSVSPPLPPRRRGPVAGRQPGRPSADHGRRRLPVRAGRRRQRADRRIQPRYGTTHEVVDSDGGGRDLTERGHGRSTASARYVALQQRLREGASAPHPENPPGQQPGQNRQRANQKVRRRTGGADQEVRTVVVRPPASTCR